MLTTLALLSAPSQARLYHLHQAQLCLPNTENQQEATGQGFWE